MSDPRLYIQTASHFLRSSLADQLYEKKECISAVMWPNPIKHAPNIHPNHRTCTWFQPAPKNTFYTTSTPPTHWQLKTINCRKNKIRSPIWHTPCPTGKRSLTSAVKPCCANNTKITNPREVILSYKILYRILNSWNATQLTYHFLEQCNIILSLNSIPII